MLEQLTPRVSYLPFSSEQNRPSLGYIRGDRFSLMVDAGNSPAHVTAYEAAVRSAGFRMPDFVALTHSHWDHCFGLSALSIPSIACVQTQQSLKLVSNLKWTPEELEQNAAIGILPRLCIPSIREQFPKLETIRVVLPTLVFQDTMTLDLGNCTCIIQHVTSPHARDTTIVFVKEERMVFLGDAVYQELVDEVWTERPAKLRKLTKALEPLDFTVCLPAHQKAMSKTDLMAWFARRLQKAEDAARKVIPS